ncbi:zinc-dependent alcohol dehydrogenase [Streptomyces candidus]|uniref:2-deoxy-scyllo-inosamine dehydrogenase n=1 Tax=Streptomyces candidus TaxID=67283 RepID=A0A7X0HJR4_9ACTN|nr:alcohol dehydrogenase catalytic domain-containing protein [Streptomyces candidus]MBB6438940.1 2-desacetyl-2-hydroxyethyl bacteriochlorophyllide A dehydrogenase [Streptomyces candidus]GHH44333.1 dehydrogenase [Streptomyces candidus]
MSPGARPGRALVIDGPGRHRLTETEPARPGPGEALVEVAAAGICMSDREVYEGRRDPGFVRYPVVPGHEWSGTVVAVGTGVEPSLVGRRTVAEGFRACGTCERCRCGETSLCSGGYAETGFTEPGAFADHVTVPARLLHLLDDDADLRAAALLEPAAVIAAAVRAGRPRPGERIAVVGAGTLGLLAVQLLTASSPAGLTVVDPRSARGEQARRFGATEAVTPEEAETSNGSYDLVIETAGAPTTAASSCLLARRGGRVVLTGMFTPGAVGIDPVHLSLSQLEVRSVFGAPSWAWSDAVRAFGLGLLDPAPLITHEFPLERFADAIALVGGGDPKTGKVLLRP